MLTPPLFQALSQPISNVLTKGGIPVPDTPLRFASVQNRSNQGSDNRTGYDTYVFRYPHYLGANMGSLKLSSMNWTLQNNQTNNGNAFTYQEVSIEAPNGVVVPVYYSGSRTKTLADGDNDIQSDLLLPSQFGYSVFARAGLYWVKGKITVPATGQYVPYSQFIVSDYSGSQAAWVPAGATLSSTDSAGVYTISGGSFSGSINVHAPILLGNPVVDGVSYFGTGDSIMFSANDMANGFIGRGFFQRAMVDADGVSNPVPAANFSQNGIGVDAFRGSNTKWKTYAAYATRGVDEILTNDVDNKIVAFMQSNDADIWAAMKTAGITKVIRTGLMARTNTTDGWATTANQTPINANWDTGGRVDQMNAWFPTQVGTAIEAFCAMTDVLDTDPNLWKVNGVANRMTNDGTHPYSNGANGIGNETAGAALRTSRIALN